MMIENHMVYKQGNIKSLIFMETPHVFELSDGSQPFITDLNGDQLDDILFNNEDPKTKP